MQASPSLIDSSTLHTISVSLLFIVLFPPSMQCAGAHTRSVARCRPCRAGRASIPADAGRNLAPSRPKNIQSLMDGSLSCNVAVKPCTRPLAVTRSAPDIAAVLLRFAQSYNSLAYRPGLPVKVISYDCGRLLGFSLFISENPITCVCFALHKDAFVRRFAGFSPARQFMSL